MCCFAVCIAAGSLLACCASRFKIPSVSQEAVEAESERQTAFQFEILVSLTDRLQSVAFPVLTANAPWCGKRTRALFGLSVLTLESLPEAQRPAATQRLGLDGTVRVALSVEGSPARRAGLAPGDRILRIGKREVGAGLEGTQQVAELLAAAKPGRVLQMTILRAGRELVLPMRGVSGCDHSAMLAGVGDSSDVARSGGIVVTPAMMRLAASRDELAMLVAHDLGHLVAGHGKSRGSADDSLLGGFPVNAVSEPANGGYTHKPYSENNEKVADYLGLYFAARAGFAVSGADAFWRKMSSPGASDAGAAHPVTPGRLALIGQVRDEIALKQQSGAPLEPKWTPR